MGLKKMQVKEPGSKTSLARITPAHIQTDGIFHWDRVPNIGIVTGVALAHILRLQK